MKLTIWYENDNCPIQPDGSISIDKKHGEYAIRPDDLDFTILDNDKENQTIKIEFPYPGPCRFLAHWEGCPPACTKFAPPPYYMEECYRGQSPELVCMHCKIYIGEYESRTNPNTLRTNERGIAELLPELTYPEAQKRHLDYIDRWEN